MKPVRVANEFADVLVELVATRNGERLEIRSPRRGTSIRLDAVELEALTWQTSETFSAMLTESIGPTADGAALGLPNGTGVTHFDGRVAHSDGR